MIKKIGLEGLKVLEIGANTSSDGDPKRGNLRYGFATLMRGKSLTCRRAALFPPGLRPAVIDRQIQKGFAVSRRLTAHRSGKAIAPPIRCAVSTTCVSKWDQCSGRVLNPSAHGMVLNAFRRCAEPA